MVITNNVIADYKLFTPLTIGKDLVLKNRVVLSPMTRARCDPKTRAPTELTALYYEQRASAGLIVTEATAVSEQGFGWYGSPGLYTEDHAKAWKPVVDRVHAKGSKIFVQIWHIGRQGHSSFNIKRELVSASSIPATQGRLRDANGEYADREAPRELSIDEIHGIVEDYRKCAQLAKQAGFDGFEIVTNGGYLIDTFLQSVTNNRTDKYGGSFEGRARFLFEVLEAVKSVWPSDRIAVRISPNASNGEMGSADNAEMFTYVLEQLSHHNLAYLAILDGVFGFNFGYHNKGRLMTAYDAKQSFKGRVFGVNSHTRDTAEGAIRTGAVDAVCFGRAFISNPDLVERFQNDWPLNPDAPREMYWDPAKEAEGYTTYPTYGQSKAE
ncbi:hypothetical protein Poli38472_010764 [Pythium oligandrum]|uniref:NADH:flavin oxidoreductase/NADH oxidase N-terminal domain-containing protein n=1 Tax=Pythium oligandrum TaxID=41045 RepID=A0A8K1CE19_PYTOL|nr:hypothetical protein Poli38472_010764 [Pythium oligandrum]|eukprot:TMW61701.1 hypothetical protein Poli38472_010764 [Pythium oligandrum]